MQSANDHQVGGTHYAGQFQHWDYVMAALKGRYLEGNITKYISRHQKKNGRQDVQKAIHYANKLMELYKIGAVQPPRKEGEVPNMWGVTQFLEHNPMGFWEQQVCIAAADWATEVRLRELINMLKSVLSSYVDEEPTSAYVSQG